MENIYFKSPLISVAFLFVDLGRGFLGRGLLVDLWHLDVSNLVFRWARKIEKALLA